MSAWSPTAWDERCEAGEQLDRRHDSMGRSAAGVADAVGHAAVVELGQAIGCECRSAAVSHQSLASHVVVPSDPHRGVDVEAFAFCAEAPPTSWLEREVGCRIGLAGDVEPLREAIEQRAVGFEAAMLVGRVATERTVKAWLDRAEERTIKHLSEEVAAAEIIARTTGRGAPPPPDAETMAAMMTLESHVLSGGLRPQPTSGAVLIAAVSGSRRRTTAAEPTR